MNQKEQRIRKDEQDKCIQKLKEYWDSVEYYENFNLEDAIKAISKPSEKI